MAKVSKHGKKSRTKKQPVQISVKRPKKKKLSPKPTLGTPEISFMDFPLGWIPYKFSYTVTAPPLMPKYTDYRGISEMPQDELEPLPFHKVESTLPPPVPPSGTMLNPAERVTIGTDYTEKELTPMEGISIIRKVLNEALARTLKEYSGLSWWDRFKINFRAWWYWR